MLTTFAMSDVIGETQTAWCAAKYNFKFFLVFFPALRMARFSCKNASLRCPSVIVKGLPRPLLWPRRHHEQLSLTRTSIACFNDNAKAKTYRFPGSIGFWFLLGTRGRVSASPSFLTVFSSFLRSGQWIYSLTFPRPRGRTDRTIRRSFLVGLKSPIWRAAMPNFQGILT